MVNKYRHYRLITGTYTKICKVNKEKWTFLNNLVLHLPKKDAWADPKISAPAADQILNRLRLKLNNPGSDRLRLCNTAKL